MSKNPTNKALTAALKETVALELASIKKESRQRLLDTVRAEKARLREEAKKKPRRIKPGQGFKDRLKLAGVQKPIRDIIYAYKNELKKIAEDPRVSAMDLVTVSNKEAAIDELLFRLMGKKLLSFVTLLPCSCQGQLQPSSHTVRARVSQLQRPLQSEQPVEHPLLVVPAHQGGTLATLADLPSLDTLLGSEHKPSGQEQEPAAGEE